MKKLAFGNDECSRCGQRHAIGFDCEAAEREPRRTLSDGTQIYPEHRRIIETGDKAGQQEGYVVLAEEERAKGFVRPLRRSYRHTKCGGVTTMGLALAETYARDPHFYSGTFCCGCRDHGPVGENGEFVWQGTDIKVGT
jgi:hypothetical protein